MSKNKTDELIPIKIDLTIGNSINESWLSMFGANVKAIMGAMFGGHSMPVEVTGTKNQVNAFSKALGSEKRYLEAINKYGLNDPKVMNDRTALNRAIRSFEKETGIVWPFK
tara:strand:+ start:1882 stop:2214 length:333 start_codon:yes stop_codon:yes gene_type:complete